jgi:hypothetical protein
MDLSHTSCDLILLSVITLLEFGDGWRFLYPITSSSLGPTVFHNTLFYILEHLAVKGIGLKEDAVKLSCVRTWFVHGDCIFMTLNGKKDVFIESYTIN